MDRQWHHGYDVVETVQSEGSARTEETRSIQTACCLGCDNSPRNVLHLPFQRQSSGDGEKVPKSSY